MGYGEAILVCFAFEGILLLMVWAHEKFFK